MDHKVLEVYSSKMYFICDFCFPEEAALMEPKLQLQFPQNCFLSLLTLNTYLAIYTSTYF